MNRKESKIEPSAYLESARQQSQWLAHQRAAMTRPLDWTALERPAARRRLAPRLRLSWALPVLAVLLLGGTTGTWAYVRHLQEVRSRKQATPAKDPPASSKSAKKSRKAKLKPRPTQKKSIARVVVKQKKPRRRQPRTKTDKKPRPAASRRLWKDTDNSITFGVHEISGGGELIIVNPPPRLKPLWTPEAYKKAGPISSPR